MNHYSILFIFIIVLISVIPALKNHLKTERKTETPTYKLDVKTKYPYKKTNLLTKTEYIFYKILKEECDKRHFLICPKVRMEDFLDVTCKNEQLKYRGYIKSRHIDFMICDQDLNILCGIELDDPSHYTQKAQKADAFKNDVFKGIGLPLYRIKTGHGSYREQLEAAFYTMIQKKTIAVAPETTKKAASDALHTCIDHEEIPLQTDKFNPYKL